MIKSNNKKNRIRDVEKKLQKDKDGTKYSMSDKSNTEILGKCLVLNTLFMVHHSFNVLSENVFTSSWLQSKDLLY